MHQRPSHQSNRIPNPKKLFDGWFWWIHRELLAEMQPTDGGNWGISAPCGLWWRVGPGIYLEIFACATSVVRCGRRERRVQNLSRKNRRRHFATTNRPGWYRSCPGFYLSVSRSPERVDNWFRTHNTFTKRKEREREIGGGKSGAWLIRPDKLSIPIT